jgi:hypothetical protein
MPSLISNVSSKIQIFAVVLMFLISGAKADLTLNGDEPIIEFTPSTVGAQSDFVIGSLERDYGLGDPFNAGDCFEIQFARINEYEAYMPG